MREAEAVVVVTAPEAGVAIEKPSRMVTIRMTPMFNNALIAAAAAAGQSLNQYCLRRLGCTEPVPPGKKRGRMAGTPRPKPKLRSGPTA